MPYSAHPHTAQEVSAQPIVPRQMLSQYHLSPHLKEEGGTVGGEGGAVGPDQELSGSKGVTPISVANIKE